MLGTVGIPTILLVILFALPFIDLRRERRLLAPAGRDRRRDPRRALDGLLTYKGATAKEALGSETDRETCRVGRAAGLRRQRRGGRGRRALRGRGCRPVPHLPRRRRRPTSARPTSRTSARRARASTTSSATSPNPAEFGNTVMPPYGEPRRGEPAARSRSSSTPPRAPKRVGVACSVFLGITGASGAPYAARLLRALVGVGLRGRHLRVGGRGRGARDRALRRRGAAARRGARALRRGRGERHGLRRRRLQEPVRVRLGEGRRLRVCPCSMATVGTIAAGAMANLIHRAASVALKEGRKLVLVPARDAALARSTSNGLATLSRRARVILFAAPGFYHGAETSTTSSTSSSRGSSTSSGSTTR